MHHTTHLPLCTSLRQQKGRAEGWINQRVRLFIIKSRRRRKCTAAPQPSNPTRICISLTALHTGGARQCYFLSPHCAVPHLHRGDSNLGISAIEIDPIWSSWESIMKQLRWWPNFCPFRFRVNYFWLGDVEKCLFKGEKHIAETHKTSRAMWFSSVQVEDVWCSRDGQLLFKKQVQVLINFV